MNEKDTSVLHSLGEDCLQAERYNRLPLKAHVLIYMCYFIPICEVRAIQEIPTIHLDNYTLPYCVLLPAMLPGVKVGPSSPITTITKISIFNNKLQINQTLHELH